MSIDFQLFKKDSYWDKALGKESYNQIDLSFFPKTKGKVLDICCGNGNLLYELDKLGWETYGVDFSTNGIAKAKELVQDATLYKLNIEYTTALYENINEKFNVIIIQNSLSFIVNKRDLYRFVEDRLVDNGIFILKTPIIKNKDTAGEISRAISIPQKDLDDVIEFFHETIEKKEKQIIIDGTEAISTILILK